MSCARVVQQLRRRHAAPARQHLAEHERHVVLRGTSATIRVSQSRRGQHVVVGERDDVAARVRRGRGSARSSCPAATPDRSTIGTAAWRPLPRRRAGVSSVELLSTTMISTVAFAGKIAAARRARQRLAQQSRAVVGADQHGNPLDLHTLLASGVAARSASDTRPHRRAA